MKFHSNFYITSFHDVIFPNPILIELWKASIYPTPSIQPGTEFQYMITFQTTSETSNLRASGYKVNQFGQWISLNDFDELFIYKIQGFTTTSNPPSPSNTVHNLFGSFSLCIIVVALIFIFIARVLYIKKSKWTQIKPVI